MDSRGRWHHVRRRFVVCMIALAWCGMLLGRTAEVYAAETNLFQWYLSEIGMPEETEEVSVVIAVIDTGISTEHEALQDCLWVNEAEANGIEGVDDDGNGYIDDIHGVNVKDSSNNIEDTYGHGTHIAGTIAMQATATSSVIGVCPQAKIMVIKVGENGSDFSTANLVKAVRYARENGADVINLSIGGRSCPATLEAELRLAAENAVIVAAAGNNGIPTEESGFGSSMNTYPAALDCVLGVMYFDEDGNLGEYSNWDYEAGTDADYEVIAPGSNIYATARNNQYTSMTGTSMACAVTSGVCGYLVSEWNSLGAQQNANGRTISEIVKDCLVSGAGESVSYTDRSGTVHQFPRVDIEGAISYMKEHYTIPNNDSENTDSESVDSESTDSEPADLENMDAGSSIPDTEDEDTGNSEPDSGSADTENSDAGSGSTGTVLPVTATPVGASAILGASTDTVTSGSIDSTSDTVTPDSTEISAQKSSAAKKTAVIGEQYLIGKAYYKVLTDSTVSLVKPKKKTYKTFTVPKTVKLYGKTYKVTKIEDKAFYKNKKLVSVTIGNSVRIIGKKSFMGCSSLKKVAIGTGVKTIKDKAFYQCSKLKVVRIKSTQVVSIGKNSFGKIKPIFDS